MGDGLPPAQCTDFQPQFIVLGEAFCAKGIAMFAHGDCLQHAAGKGAAHTSRRKPGAQPTAHHKHLVVRFDELVAIMTADERRPRYRNRAHRQLNEIEPFDKAIVERYFIGVDQILCIMEDDGLRGLAGEPFTFGCLNNPAKLNAMNEGFFEEARAAFVRSAASAGSAGRSCQPASWCQRLLSS